MDNLANQSSHVPAPHSRASYPHGRARKILVVDDEPNMAFGFRMNLEQEGYEVAVAETGHAALDLHRSFEPEVILLDLRLPDLHGLEALRRIRESDRGTRVVIVSCLVEPEDREAGLRAGANDYQVKPFAVMELMGRIRVQLELARGAPPTSRDPKLDFLILDPANRTVHFRGHVIELSTKPFALLARLVDGGGNCVTKEEILREVWHFRELPDTHTIEQHIAHLRHALHTDSSAPEVILTVYGRGYRINPAVLPPQ
ncbi:MAG: response regulator transcription factor [Longimicrobiales bacterium]